MTTSKEPILVPKLLAWAAQENPDGVARRDPLFSWDDVQSLKTLPWRETTWKDFNQLVDAGAFLFSERGWPVRGKNEQQATEPIKVAVFLSTELASCIALYALIKCGNSVLLPSPRNSINVLVDMLVQEGIERIIFSSVYEAVAKSVGDELAKRQVGLAPTLAPIPSQEELDDRKETCGVFPYELDDELEWKRPIWFVHTSGSSGMVPTICPYTHQIMVETARAMTLGNIQGENHISLAPLFHLMVHIRGPIYCALNRDTVTTGPMGPPPSATQLAALISKSNCDGITVVPQLLKALTETPGGLDALKRLKGVKYGAAALPNKTKRALDDAGIKHVNSYGLSEASVLADCEPDRWPANVKLDTDWMTSTGLHTLKFEFFSKASDGVPDLYELIALAGDIPCSVSNVPGGYATGDLVERHPDYPEWFRIWGRKKAIVVLANGENAPIRALEEALEAHPWVRTALVYGTARPQVGVLVELDPEHAVGKGNQEADAAARNELWPTIEKVNAELPDFARLFKSMILFASPEVPIPRTDKGTPKRQVAMKMYEDDIDNLYTSVAAGTGAAVQFNSVDQESLQKMVISILHTIYGDDKEINPDTSLTLELGQDSLRATMTRTSIVASLRAASQSGNVPELAGFMPDDVPTLIAYQYSTPATLAWAVMGYGRSKAVVEKLISSAVHEAGVEAMSIRFGQRP
ncbi:unnamed protein product [Tilletia controversa]|nr:unnamed protein product [Tilletia controversa]